MNRCFVITTLENLCHPVHEFAYVIRTAGANLRGNEFEVSYAVGVARVPAIALLAHTDCGMAHVTEKRDVFVRGLVEWAGCKAEDASRHFSTEGRKKAMSLIQKLHSVLAVVVILTSGTISVTAQTPAPAESSATKSIPDAVSKNESNKESKKPPIAGSEKTSLEKMSPASRDAGNENSLEVAGAPTTNAKTATLSETETPRSPQDVNADKWQFQFSPYFWLASLHGTAGVGNRTTQVDESFGDIFDSLKFALMGTFEARKGKFILLTDMEYVSVEDDRATPGPFFSDVTAKFKVFIFDPEAGYRLYDNPAKAASVDVLGGIRVWHVSTELDFGAGILPATQIDGSRTWVDGIFGLRGKTALSEKMFVTGKFDLGGGGSNFTWHLFGGGGYNITPSIALIFGYRVLDVNYNKDNFIYDMNQRGPIMGVGFKF